MNDQANSLRKLVSNSTHTPETKVIAVASGKGGVGKSNFSLNFAIGLSQAGKKVVLFDLDIGMANVDILMGCSAKYNVIDLIEHELTIWDIIESGPENIDFISGGSGLTKLFKLSPLKFERFIQQMESLYYQYDYIILDMGAGATEDSIQFILAANEVIVITTPEPTSITDAYAMMKHIHQKERYKPCSIVVNRAFSEKEGIMTGENLQRASRRFLDKEAFVLGYIPDDVNVQKAVRKQDPFIILFPNTHSSKALKRIIDKFLGISSMNKESSLSTFVGKLKRFLIER